MMNYFTGLALGVSAGRQLHGLLGAKGFQLIHAVPGRRRYQHDTLLHNPELALRWERQLPKMPGLSKVRFTPETGTVLIEYTCSDHHIDIFVDYLEQIHKIPEAHSRYGKVGTDIRNCFRRLNREIFANTNRNLDLRTVLALSFVLWGGTKMWSMGHRPTGPQMIWWAYSLLKGRS